MAEEAQDPEEAAEGEGGAAESAPPPKKSMVGKFVILVLIILIAQSAAVYFLVDKTLLPKIRPEEEVEGETVTRRSADTPKIPIDAPFLFPLAVDTDEILVNPVDPIMIRFLNAQLILEMDSEESLLEMSNPVTARKVRELVRSTLANTPYEQLNDPEERAAIRDTLRIRINRSRILEVGEVARVFFIRYVLN
jgi:flagellar basal body-associated protein FliL